MKVCIYCYAQYRGRICPNCGSSPHFKKGGTRSVSIKCRIWWEESSQSYVVSCSYKPGFVDSVKQLIPSGSRTYDPNTKFWNVTEQYGEFLRKLAETAFGVGCVSFTSRNVTQQAGASSQQRAYSGSTNPLTSNGNATTEDCVVAFMNLVPYDAAKRAYLLAAQSHHPDKGGDAQKMSRLNELWTRIEKEFYKR
jgi:hypothetical protein